ncbi:MAG TPA: DMT family transporter [Xanthobacteraceae bacterium]|nr:DMT family transporter [Xanthobacteraceae bacterium]
MTGTVLAAVLVGALIHASWNALIKAQADKFAAATLVAIGAGVISLPIIAWLPAPPPAAWPYIAASSIIHVGYFALVGLAYRTADLGVAYPLTRGTAPPLTALFAFLIVGEALGLNQWLAIVVIAAGILTLSGDAILRGGLTGATALAAFANAGVIVVYTLVDGLGARAAGSGLIYVTWMNVGTAVLLAVLLLAMRGRRFVTEARTNWMFGLGAGALALTSYAIALWAMTLAPIGLVAALRETSVLFAAILGTIFFGEPFSARRWLALLLIVAGIIALRLNGS